MYQRRYPLLFIFSLEAMASVCLGAKSSDKQMPHYTASSPSKERKNIDLGNLSPTGNEIMRGKAMVLMYIEQIICVSTLHRYHWRTLPTKGVLQERALESLHGAGGYEGMRQFPPIPISHLLRAPQYGYGDVAIWIAEPCHKRRNMALSLTVLFVDSRFMIVKVFATESRPDVLAQAAGRVSYRHPKIYHPSFLMVLVPDVPTPDGCYPGQECLKAGTTLKEFLVVFSALHSSRPYIDVLVVPNFLGPLIQMVTEKYALFCPRKTSQLIDPNYNEQIASLYVWEASHFSRLEWLEVGEIGSDPNPEHRGHHPPDHLPEPNATSLHDIQGPFTLLRSKGTCRSTRGLI
ncbi:hypothetical protein EV421DRAFT_1738103 [Armillaria borealis]|uniref:Uncharacterized protein n=1 Tax=Armillaria borealis TaxID=47425 RepID=A0AA39JBT2_9AGAR|nr:hypothetical protein EV421DRAFT_1738103 [Armillaria borealis]